MHEIHPNRLWLGYARDIREPRRLLEAGITAVVDVALEEPLAQLPRHLIYCRFPPNDGGGNENAVLLQAIQTLADLLDSGTRTIVACSAGMSRCPTVAAFALAAHLSQKPDDVIARIAGVKPLELNRELWDEVARIFPIVRRADSRRFDDQVGACPEAL